MTFISVPYFAHRKSKSDKGLDRRQTFDHQIYQCQTSVGVHPVFRHSRIALALALILSRAWAKSMYGNANNERPSEDVRTGSCISANEIQSMCYTNGRHRALATVARSCFDGNTNVQTWSSRLPLLPLDCQPSKDDDILLEVQLALHHPSLTPRPYRLTVPIVVHP
jgi:hypothetical protein